MKFIQIKNNWINIDNINMLVSSGDGKTMIYFNGYNTPVQFDESIECIIKKISVKSKEI